MDEIADELDALLAIDERLAQEPDCPERLKWGDRFRSNSGRRGGVEAVIVKVSPGEVTMRRGKHEWDTFTLPLWFFSSPSCGWKKL